MINRREAIRRVTIIMGGALSSSAIAGVLQGCSAKKSLHWKPAFLSEKQAVTMAEVAERILPRTTTPGAKDAGVPEFIDVMLKDIYTKEEQERFVAGLKKLEDDSRSTYKELFTDLQPQQQDALLKECAKENRPTGKGKPFFFEIKQLTMLGFFTSEIGAKQFLHYVAVPGKYEACISLEGPEIQPA